MGGGKGAVVWQASDSYPHSPIHRPFTQTHLTPHKHATKTTKQPNTIIKYIYIFFKKTGRQRPRPAHGPEHAPAADGAGQPPPQHLRAGLARRPPPDARARPPLPRVHRAGRRCVSNMRYCVVVVFFGGGGCLRSWIDCVGVYLWERTGGLTVLFCCCSNNPSITTFRPVNEKAVLALKTWGARFAPFPASNHVVRGSLVRRNACMHILD
jgi:hypothetical protein